MGNFLSDTFFKSFSSKYVYVEEQQRWLLLLMYSLPYILYMWLQRFKQEWKESPAGTRQTDGKHMVWFGELERKLAKL